MQSRGYWLGVLGSFVAGCVVMWLFLGRHSARDEPPTADVVRPPSGDEVPPAARSPIVIDYPNPNGAGPRRSIQLTVRRYVEPRRPARFLAPGPAEAERDEWVIELGGMNYTCTPTFKQKVR
jgi:hypothetical protein